MGGLSQSLEFSAEDILADTRRLQIVTRLFADTKRAPESVRIGIDDLSQAQALHVVMSQMNGTLKNLWTTVNADSLVLWSKKPTLTVNALMRNLHGHAGGLISNPDHLLSRTDECWDEHLAYTRNHLRDERRHQRTTDIPLHKVESRIRGRSAEFILQMTLERYANTFTLGGGYQKAALVDRRKELKLPSSEDGFASFRWRPTTFHNGEIKMHSRIGNRSYDRRGGPLTESDVTLTEIDAAITTDFRDNAPGYGSLILLDTTTDQQQHRVKADTKPTRLQPVFQALEAHDVTPHFISVLLYDPENPPRHLPEATNGNVSTMALPLAPLVDRITRRTASELGERIQSDPSA